MSNLVYVVGAGPAGLAAAFRLQKAGVNVRIIEASSVIGGKLQSQQRNGFTIDTGAIFLPTRHKNMMSLAVEAGFADQIERLVAQGAPPIPEFWYWYELEDSDVSGT